ncbi:MAG: FtsH protease activity modulator HflK [Pseudomonadota bacterium]|nr:MAG: FtsH protease activity modulator HflK [Pseudomonadota bacterium]
MAWNEPGSPGGKDPWGQRRRGANTDLDQVVRNIQRKLAGIFGGRGRGGDGGEGGGAAAGYGFGLIVLVILGVWLATGTYIVQQGERGVVLRFGKKADITEAGLHWRFPYPIERVERVNVEKVSTIEIGYRSDPRSGTKRKVPKEALMLTEDENIIDLEFAVQYKVKDAADYIFNVRDPEGTIAQATESAVRETIGRSTMDFALTEGRDQVNQSTRGLLQEILDRYKAGIHIVTIEMQKAQPPEEVKAAFDDAVKAREDEQRAKNEAEAYANDILPRARGASARMVQEAEGYKVSTISRAEGDARRFTLIASEFAKAPAVTRERMYIETMEQVMSNTSKVLVDQKGGNNILYLPLDKIVGGRDPSGAAAQMPMSEPEAAGSGQPNARGRTDLRRRGGQP